jgi:hypothetical protein
MLAQIRNSRWFRVAHLALLVGGVCALSSCATKSEPPLVSDNVKGQESSLPWNQQEKWENAGQFGEMAQRMNGGTR